MKQEISKCRWYSFPLLINPMITKYSGAFTGRFIAIAKAVESTRVKKEKENIKTYVS